MKSSEQLKKELHEYIDSIDDEETLWMVREEIVEYIKKENLLEEDDNNDLTEEQNKRLNEAIRQANAGEVMDLDEFKRRMSLWHTK